jgi:hypothetical protein
LFTEYGSLTNMVQTCYAKYGVVSGLLLLLCAIVLSITDSQRLAFAQITPASEKAGGSDDDSSSNSSPNTEGGKNNDDGSDGSSGSSSGSSGDSSSSDEQDDSTDDSSGTIKNDRMTTSQGAEETNPLSEAITNKVRQELAAAGITDLGY